MTATVKTLSDLQLNVLLQEMNTFKMFTDVEHEREFVETLNKQETFTNTSYTFTSGYYVVHLMKTSFGSDRIIDVRFDKYNGSNFHEEYAINVANSKLHLMLSTNS